MKRVSCVEREVLLQEVQTLVYKYLFPLGIRVYLFGSWARAEERRMSDIDLAVWYETPVPVGTISKLRLAFEESNIPYRIEIVDLTRTDRKFREKIMMEGVEWKKAG